MIEMIKSIDLDRKTKIENYRPGNIFREIENN